MDFLTQAEQAKVVSLDIFDTAIYRGVGKPQDLFSCIDHHDPDFKRKRIEAERKANHKAWAKGIEAPTLLDIYREFSDNPAQGVSMEQRAELLVCRSNPEILNFYLELKRKNKNIIFTSDQYHSSAFLTSILRVTGYKGITPEQVFVSCETHVCKSSGKMFTHILNKFNLKPSELFHIGDYYPADYDTPRRMGITSFHYSKKKYP